jgi:hypothetical protein
MQCVEATPRAQQEVRLASRSAYFLFETTSRMSPTHPQGGVESYIAIWGEGGGVGKGERKRQKIRKNKEERRKMIVKLKNLNEKICK